MNRATVPTVLLLAAAALVAACGDDSEGSAKGPGGMGVLAETLFGGPAQPIME